MLETAKKEGYAYPAVNVTTIEVINGALRAFSEAKSDGIIQVSIGGGKFASGSSVGNSALGAIVLAEATRRLAEKHNVLVALHTDHCQPEHVDTFLRPLIAESRRRVERGEAPLFKLSRINPFLLPFNNFLNQINNFLFCLFINFKINLNRNCLAKHTA